MGKLYLYLYTVTRLLTTHPYVVVIALDFSKASDNVRHSTLLNKVADLDILDDVYKWLVSYFSGHSHCTRYGGESSALLEISAGIIQGSGIGPASYVVNSSYLAALTPGNSLCKYADDTYIIIPSDIMTVDRKSSSTWIRFRALSQKHDNIW